MTFSEKDVDDEILSIQEGNKHSADANLDMLIEHIRNLRAELMNLAAPDPILDSTSVEDKKTDETLSYSQSDVIRFQFASGAMGAILTDPLAHFAVDDEFTQDDVALLSYGYANAMMKHFRSGGRVDVKNKENSSPPVDPEEGLEETDT